jgi:hypothetical protein
LGRFAIIIGVIFIVLLVFVVLYVGSLYSGPNPDDLPPGILRGNISITDAPGYSINDALSYPILGIENTDGWKYASPIFMVPEGDQYSYNVSIFPGHFLVTLNGSFASSDLPKSVTIESGKTTIFDVTLIPTA